MRGHLRRSARQAEAATPRPSDFQARTSTTAPTSRPAKSAASSSSTSQKTGENAAVSAGREAETQAVGSRPAPKSLPQAEEAPQKAT